MAPDLNSLPPSRSTSASSTRARRSSVNDDPTRRASSSVAAAVAANINLPHRPSHPSSRTSSPRLERPPEHTRTSGRMSLALGDSSVPRYGDGPVADHRASTHTRLSFSSASPTSLGGRGTIATGDPHHHQRQPSLGDIHNELEQEQEAQVNRMLHLIRAQQHQLEQIQRAHPDRTPDQPTPTQHLATSSMAVIDDATPGSERSFSFSRPGTLSHHPSSANRSPALRPVPFHDGNVSGPDELPSPSESIRRGSRRNSIRDETAYYQAETANLNRENLMLKMRIRELEKQVSELNVRSNRATDPARPEGGGHTGA